MLALRAFSVLFVRYVNGVRSLFYVFDCCVNDHNNNIMNLYMREFHVYMFKCALQLNYVSATRCLCVVFLGYVGDVRYLCCA